MRIPVVVVGAGHAGLAASYFLAKRSIDHVILERGEVANTWLTERWKSLRLLTPNWQSRLPGHVYEGSDPDGFMSMAEVVDFINGYARLIRAPVSVNTTVESVRAQDDGYVIDTNQGVWESRAVVLASGGFNLPRVPPEAERLPVFVASVTPHEYLGPDDLPDGGALVVGASATGIQIAEEIRRSGRPVTISVGEHVRMPRVYRGRDIQWWMDRSGRLDERYDEVDDLVRARHVPSPQLVGSVDRRTLDLNALTQAGVKAVGRLSAIVDGTAHFSGSLPNVCKLADLKLGRLLTEFDEWAMSAGIDRDMDPPERLAPTEVEGDPVLSLRLEGGAIRTVIWATGFRSDYSWLDIPVLDRKGEIRHDGGVVVGSPGLYRMGLNFLRRRKSSFIHGAEDDARDLIEHLARYLNKSLTRAH